MRKMDKIIDNQLISALTDVCDVALVKFTGFQWLTHSVNYSSFPDSLKIICVLDSNDNLDLFMANNHNIEMSQLMERTLLEAGINLKNTTNHITYDTQQNCDKYDNGKWTRRLSK